MSPVSPFDLLVAALAASQAVHTWHHAEVRWLVRARASDEERAKLYDDGVPGHFGAAARHCAYCMTHWVAPPLVAACGLPSLLGLPGLKGWLMLPMYALAAIRIATATGAALARLDPPRAG